MSRLSTFIFFSLVLLVQNLWGQTEDILNKKVTISHQSVPVKTVFDAISKQTGAVFSYSNFNDAQYVSIQTQDETLRSVLQIIQVKTSCAIHTKGKYIIVRSAPKPPLEFQLYGSVIDKHTGQAVHKASVYVSSERVGAITDPDGGFNLKLTSPKSPLKLTIAKDDYQDTSIIVIASKNTPLNIYLGREPLPLEEALSSLSFRFDSLVGRPLPALNMMPVDTHRTYVPEEPQFWTRLRKTNVNFRNIRDTLFSNFAFSLIPPVSTNNMLAINTKSNFSINLISGYTKGIGIMEIGGMMNVDNGDVRFLQAAGLANIVSGKMLGIQIAGLYNSVGNRADGLQAAALYNRVSGDATGIQIGGLANKSHSIIGLQAATLLNVVKTKSTGLQITGLVSSAPVVKGAQIAGIANYARDTLQGVQLSAIYNYASNVHGLQLTGILNVADTLRGVQFGLFNFAKTVEKGVPIGLISYVPNGYHKLEMSYDDLQFFNMSFRTGVDLFHTVFTGGVTLPLEKELLSYGMGIGSSLALGKNFALDFDVSTRYIQEMRDPTFGFNLDNQFGIALRWKFNDKVGIRVGPVAHMFLVDPNTDFYPTALSIVPKEAEVDRIGRFDSFVWPGFKASVLLF